MSKVGQADSKLCPQLLGGAASAALANEPAPPSHTAQCLSLGSARDFFLLHGCFWMWERGAASFSIITPTSAATTAARTLHITGLQNPPPASSTSGEHPQTPGHNVGTVSDQLLGRLIKECIFHSRPCTARPATVDVGGNQGLGTSSLPNTMEGFQHSYYSVLLTGEVATMIFHSN